MTGKEEEEKPVKAWTECEHNTEHEPLDGLYADKNDGYNKASGTIFGPKKIFRAIR